MPINQILAISSRRTPEIVWDLVTMFSSGDLNFCNHQRIEHHVMILSDRGCRKAPRAPSWKVEENVNGPFLVAQPYED